MDMASRVGVHTSTFGPLHPCQNNGRGHHSLDQLAEIQINRQMLLLCSVPSLAVESNSVHHSSFLSRFYRRSCVRHHLPEAMVWRITHCPRPHKPEFLNSSILKQSFYVLTVTLLGLLLPLSFLLLARLSCLSYYSSIFADSIPQIVPFPLSLFYTNPTPLHALVAIITVCTLLHGLTGRITLLTESPLLPPPGLALRQACLPMAWAILCALQVCVGLGIEGSIAAGVDGSPLRLGGVERSLLSKAVFFLGLHETTVYWSRAVVRPVADDTVFGGMQAEGPLGRVVAAAGFGWLWWWRLRGEVEAMVVVPEVKKELLMGIGVADFVGWWLYYLTVTIGMVRIVKGLMWIGIVLFCRKVKEDLGGEPSLDEEIV